jgi:hypothetical protein
MVQKAVHLQDAARKDLAFLKNLALQQIHGCLLIEICFFAFSAGNISAKKQQ